MALGRPDPLRAHVRPHRTCAARAHEYYIVCRLDGDDGDVCVRVCARVCTKYQRWYVRCVRVRVSILRPDARVRACVCACTRMPFSIF